QRRSSPPRRSSDLAGRIESETRDFTLRVERGYRSPEQFSAIPLRKGEDGYVVRLGDVAEVEIGPRERRSYARSNDVPNVGLGIVRTSTANALDVARAARAEGERIQQTLPEGTEIFVSSDNTQFIEAAVERVYWTLGEAMLQSEEHTSELQSRENRVCRLLLGKKKQR